MDEHNNERMLRLIVGAILIALISAVGTYMYLDDQNMAQQQQIEEQKQKEENDAKEIQRLKAEKDVIEKQHQEEEAKREAERAAEEERRIREKYTHYHNDTFGFSIDVPKNFIITSRSATGIYLISPDGKGLIFAIGAHKTDHETNRQQYEDQVMSAQRVGGKITYHVCGDDWYVVSWHKGEEGNYLKKYTNRDSELLFVVMFPMSQKDEYAPMIEHMEDTFRRDRT